METWKSHINKGIKIKELTLLSTYYVPDIMISNLYSFSHVTLKYLGTENIYHPHFIDQESEVQKS